MSLPMGLTRRWGEALQAPLPSTALRSLPSPDTVSVARDRVWLRLTDLLTLSFAPAQGHTGAALMGQWAGAQLCAHTPEVGGHRVATAGLLPAPGPLTAGPVRHPGAGGRGPSSQHFRRRGLQEGAIWGAARGRPAPSSSLVPTLPSSLLRPWAKGHCCFKSCPHSPTQAPVPEALPLGGQFS